MGCDAWWAGIRNEISLSRITVGEVRSLKRSGTLGRVAAALGFGPEALAGLEDIDAMADRFWLAARQQRPETTIDDIHAMPLTGFLDKVIGDSDGLVG